MQRPSTTWGWGGVEIAPVDHSRAISARWLSRNLGPQGPLAGRLARFMMSKGRPSITCWGLTWGLEKALDSLYTLFQ
jgi:hypothetical protein